MLFGLGHGSVNCRDDEYTCIHFCCSCDHVFDVIDMSRTIDVGIVPTLCFVLKSCSVDCDSSSFFLRSLVDFAVFYVFGLLSRGEELGYGRCECGLSMVYVSDCAHWIGSELPLTWGFERSNLANPWSSFVFNEKVLETKLLSITITNKYINLILFFQLITKVLLFLK